MFRIHEVQGYIPFPIYFSSYHSTPLVASLHKPQINKHETCIFHFSVWGSLYTSPIVTNYKFMSYTPSTSRGSNENCPLLWNPNVKYDVHLVINQLNQFHSITPHLFNTCFNVIISGKSPKWYFSLLFNTVYFKKLGSSVSIVSGYGLDDQAIEVRSQAEAKGFFL
jgi:hypothetical protein